MAQWKVKWKLLYYNRVHIGVTWGQWKTKWKLPYQNMGIMENKMEITGIIGLYKGYIRGNIRGILGLYLHNGKDNGNYYIFPRGYAGS